MDADERMASMTERSTKFEGSTSIGQGPGSIQDVRAGRAADGGAIALASDVSLPQLDGFTDFEPGAAACLNRALQVALSLGHATFSSDHLMLALTMDPHARKLLQRVADVGPLRETAMARLGRMHWKFARRADHRDRFPAPTSDLDEIRKAARTAAADREQRVSINDLVNAFPTKDGRLVYGPKETTESVPVILERIESKLVPHVTDFLAKFETQMREGVEKQLRAAMDNFSRKELKAIVERQLAESMRMLGERQAKETAERQHAALAEIGKDFKERHLAAMEGLGAALQARQLGALEEFGKDFKDRHLAALEGLGAALQARQIGALEEIGKDFKDQHFAALEGLGAALQARQIGALEEIGRDFKDQHFAAL